MNFLCWHSEGSYIPSPPLRIIVTSRLRLEIRLIHLNSSTYIEEIDLVRSNAGEG
jgi:hypothetical protein